MNLKHADVKQVRETPKPQKTIQTAYLDPVRLQYPPQATSWCDSKGLPRTMNRVLPGYEAQCAEQKHRGAHAPAHAYPSNDPPRPRLLHHVHIVRCYLCIGEHREIEFREEET